MKIDVLPFLNMRDLHVLGLITGVFFEIKVGKNVTCEPLRGRLYYVIKVILVEQWASHDIQMVKDS